MGRGTKSCPDKIASSGRASRTSKSTFGTIRRRARSFRNCAGTERQIQQRIAGHSSDYDCANHTASRKWCPPQNLSISGTAPRHTEQDGFFIVTFPDPNGQFDRVKLPAGAVGRVHPVIEDQLDNAILTRVTSVPPVLPAAYFFTVEIARGMRRGDKIAGLISKAPTLFRG